MTTRKSYIILFFLFFNCLLSIGQIDTLISIEAIEIVDQKILDPDSYFTLNLNNNSKQNPISSSLDELLSDQSNIFIKSYGSNSIASSSIFGGNASQTLVLWNGIPIANAMHGQTDLALLNPLMVDNIHIQKGGNSSVWGSGAIGGMIILENKKDKRLGNSLTTHTQLGQYGQFFEQLDLKFKLKKFASQTKLSLSENKNNFPIKINGTDQIIEQQHAQFSKKEVIQSFFLNVNDQSNLSLHIWKQIAEREIPPTLVQTMSNASQEDDYLRSILQWNRKRKNLTLHSSLAYLQEKILFSDQIQRIQSPSEFKSIIADVKGRLRFSDIDIILGLNSMRLSAQSDFYENIQREWRASSLLTFAKEFNKSKLQSGLRQEFFDDQFAPLSPFLIWSGQTRSFYYQAEISRNFRLPGMNDRYWQPGGQLNLKPENGWSQKLSLGFDQKHQIHHFDMKANIFNRYIHDWIQWVFLPDQNFWSASNIAEVWSRGFDLSTEWKAKINQKKWSILNQYTFTKSTNEVELEFPKTVKGSQLIYTPVHQFRNVMGFSSKQFSAQLRNRFTGPTTGINQNIESYFITNITLGYFNQWKSLSYSLRISCNNIFDQQYFIIENRPMVGRNFNLTLGVEFNTTNNE